MSLPSRTARLDRRQSPMRCAFTPGLLAQAARLDGLGHPIGHIAQRLRVNARALETELHRIGAYRRLPEISEADADLVLRMRLSRAERTILGSAAVEREMYRPALAEHLLRALLQGDGLDDALAALDDRRRP